MPREFFRRLGQGLFNRQHSVKSASRQSGVRPFGAAIEAGFGRSLPQIENLESRQLLSATYFVATTGSDGNPGTIGAPFKTIQHAATVATSGSVVNIETGTYHETVTPKYSGVTYEAYNGESVTVSGANPLTGWSAYSGSIYKAPMPVDLGLGNNQVYVNGQALNEARFPNTSLNPSSPTTEAIQSVSVHGNSATIYDSHFTQAANYWKGAIIHFDPGQNWVNQTGTVTSSAVGSVTFSFANGGKYATPAKGDKFYIFGKLQSLDSAGEWYRDPTSGQVYVWAPNGANPAGADVESRVRSFAFDLSSVNNITIYDIKIFAATIKTSGASSHVVLNKITADYVSQFQIVTNGWQVNKYNGIMLEGSGSILENSTIEFSSGNGVVVSGSGSQITNNIIHDVDTVGASLSGIEVITSGVTVSHNTVYNAGRDGIDASVHSVQILYNTVHDVGLQTTEPGGIYTVNINAGGKSVIAYNTVYNMHTAGYGGTGVFCDNDSCGWIVHNNITYNVDYGFKLNFVSTNDNVYNNTFGATILSINSNQKGSWGGTIIKNNVVPRGMVLGSGAKVSGNVTTAIGGVGAGSVSSGAQGI